MSAIAGIFDFNHQDISPEEINTINSVSTAFVTDRTDSYSEPGLFFSCCHQYFTREAVNDISPIYDKEKKIVFNADIFLYNREELIELLKDKKNMSDTVLALKGDAELAFLTYLEFGIDFVTILDGIYSIIILDRNCNNIYMITDYVSGRHMAYAIANDKLYYSTTLHVVSALLKNPQINEEWVCTAYADATADSERIKGQCVYKDIFRVEPGHYIKIDFHVTDNCNNKYTLENIEYWNPLKTVKPLKLSSDEEYGKIFRETLIKSVTRMLRARKAHGIYLSGGLDSSSVASIAAGALAKTSSKLYSYTQVPCPEYNRKNSFLFIEDETDCVLKNKEKYPNIVCRFLTSTDLTLYSEPEKYIRRFAQPVKPIANASYIYAMDEAVKHDNISIVFTGSGGNFTISYGKITSYIFQKNQRFQYLKSIRAANAFCKLYHANRLHFLRFYLSERFKRFKQQKISSYINKKLVKQYKLKKRLKKYFDSFSGKTIDSFKEWKNCIFHPLLSQHTFYHHTCASLFTGAVYLDPTMTKDIIELCIAMPIDCFVKDGKERRTIRDYLKGIVSDDILDNLHQRGVQGSDVFYKVSVNWNQTKDTLFDNLKVNELDKYIDRKKIDFLIEELKEKEYNTDKGSIIDASVLSVLGCFLKNYKKYIEVDKWIKTEKSN